MLLVCVRFQFGYVSGWLMSLPRKFCFYLLILCLFLRFICLILWSMKGLRFGLPLGEPSTFKGVCKYLFLSLKFWPFCGHIIVHAKTLCGRITGGYLFLQYFMSIFSLIMSNIFVSHFPLLQLSTFTDLWSVAWSFSNGGGCLCTVQYWRQWLEIASWESISWTCCG